MRIPLFLSVVVAAAAAALASVTVPVTVIHTTLALDEPQAAYPRAVTLDAPAGLALGAYGAAGKVWLGPAGWTGRATSGVDGTTRVELFPKGSGPSSIRRVTYHVVPACLGCMLSGAAPFFPAAMNHWNAEFNADGRSPVNVPSGLVVDALTPTLVRYTLPDIGSMKVTGAAFYDPSDDGLFATVRVQLSAGESGVAAFLLKHFGETIAADTR